MELQHFNIKIPVETPQTLELEKFVPVFHRWIQQRLCPELLIDVADYLHVTAGPGVVLIGHEADYSLDESNLKPGLRYNRKATLEGDNEDRLRQALHAVWQAVIKLETDEALQKDLRFSRKQMQVFINDRALAPNHEPTYQALLPWFENFFSRRLKGSFQINRLSSDKRERFGIEIQTQEEIDALQLI